MADAAYAAAIPPGFQVAAGYYGGPNAYHVWPAADWGRFPGLRLPIWVGGMEGAIEGAQAVAALRALRVPPWTHALGTMTALDMETRHDVTYVNAFQAVLNAAGFLVWDYGSLSTVYRDPEANGYWVADYTDLVDAEGVLAQIGTRAVQYAAGLPGAGGGQYDASLVKPWVAPFLWTGGA